MNTGSSPRIRLPIEDCLDELKLNLHSGNEAVLEAPPGAGKTTLVPLALIDESWLGNSKIIMLEPRRIATKTAAHRMASLLGEAPGQTVGYRMRLDNKIGKNTKIEVITEGILTRMLQQDPSLEDVGLVIFDEFHERSLESDLALSLCLQGRTLFRDDDNPLKILVMSATLDGEAIAKMLGNAPIIQSEGRTYPVDIIHGRTRKSKEPIVERMTAAIKQALEENPTSSLLAFLPGQGEIRRCVGELENWLLDKQIKDIHLRPLYGNLSIEDQQAAIAPLSDKQANDQKVVLATNIAETSLTIEGVDVVVDSGLAREPSFNPSTAMTALQTVKVSKASSTQRAGRAGRMRPGKCYRLWSAEQQQQLAAHSTAEILKADLTPLALQLLQWGIDDPTELKWLDPPPKGAWLQAIDLLESLGAIDNKSGTLVLSAHGQSMCALPTHPRLAHLLIRGAENGQAKTASLLAVILSDRNPLSQDNPDISNQLDILNGETQCPPQHQGWLHRSRQLAKQFLQQLDSLDVQKPQISYLLTPEQLCGFLLACAYPDRIARQRYSGGYQLANGRSASFSGHCHLSKNQWLTVAEVSSITGDKGDTIRSAARLDEALFTTALSELVSADTVTEWDKKTNRFNAESQQKIGTLILHRKKLDEIPLAAKTGALLGYIRKEGLKLLPWKPEHLQWCARVMMLHSYNPNQDWPDVSEENLLATLEDWLAPFLDKVNLLQDFKKLDLTKILYALLTWEKRQQLEQLAPTRLTVPSGSSIAIDYTSSPPVLSVKLQEMFGCEQTPTVANGKIKLIVHLLSPAGRPLQITQDLAGFWRTSYHDVKKEMKGRYPKHPWPDDPIQATPTRKTKARA